MNKQLAICISGALVVLVCVCSLAECLPATATSVSPPSVEGDGTVVSDVLEEASWCADPEAGTMKINAQAPSRWSVINNGICNDLCRDNHSHSHYANNNWAIFWHAGLECCCATNELSAEQSQAYENAKPYVSDHMAEQMNITKDTPLASYVTVASNLS